MVQSKGIRYVITSSIVLVYQLLGTDFSMTPCPIVLIWLIIYNPLSALPPDHQRELQYWCIIPAFINLSITVVPMAVKIKSIWKHLWEIEKASNILETGPYEVAGLDIDSAPNSPIRQSLKNHTCRSLTIVLPCYMPNEQAIIMDVLGFYRKEIKHIQAIHEFS